MCSCRVKFPGLSQACQSGSSQHTGLFPVFTSIPLDARIRTLTKSSTIAYAVCDLREHVAWKPIRQTLYSVLRILVHPAVRICLVYVFVYSVALRKLAPSHIEVNVDGNMLVRTQFFAGIGKMLYKLGSVLHDADTMAKTLSKELQRQNPCLEGKYRLALQAAKGARR